MMSIISYRWLLAVALPLLAATAIYLWAGWLRQRGRFSGAPGRGHAWAATRFDTVRLRETAADIAALGSPTLVAAFTALFGLAFLGHHDLRAAVILSAASILAGWSGTMLKRLTGRTRPKLAVAAHFGSSYPSSHTLMSTTLYGTAAVLLVANGAWPSGEPLLLMAAALIAGAVGASRIVLRVHYLSDVIAGWFMGAALCGAALLVY